MPDLSVNVSTEDLVVWAGIWDWLDTGLGLCGVVNGGNLSSLDDPFSLPRFGLFARSSSQRP